MFSDLYLITYQLCAFRHCCPTVGLDKGRKYQRVTMHKELNAMKFIVHDIFHVLGRYHEYQRNDRGWSNKTNQKVCLKPYKINYLFLIHLFLKNRGDRRHFIYIFTSYVFKLNTFYFLPAWHKCQL